MADIDTSKPYRQRCGLCARFLGEINNPEYPLAFAYETRRGTETVSEFARNGRWITGENGDEDIVNFEEGEQC